MKLSNTASYVARSKNNRIACLGDRNTSSEYQSQKVIDFVSNEKELALSTLSSNMRKTKTLQK
jgi:hypothetical protein